MINKFLSMTLPSYFKSDDLGQDLFSLLFCLLVLALGYLGIYCFMVAL